jgi:two-component system NtrC family sensor kinase
LRGEIMLLDSGASVVVSGSAARAKGRPRATRLGRLWVPIVMILAVAVVATVAFWDEERESQAALEDFAEEQAILAVTAASSLADRLAGAVRDASVIASPRIAADAPLPLTEPYASIRIRRQDESPDSSHAPSAGFMLTVPLRDAHAVDLFVTNAGLFGRLASLERRDAVRLLILPPRENTFHTTDARLMTNDGLRAALDAGRSSARLSRAEASSLGLPHRTALAGLARLDAGPLGSWGVAVVASAERERDRETRASLRLALGVLIAAGLVLGFGTLAMRKQHGELVLERELAVAELSRERDERLLRADRVATMGTLAIGLAHELSTPLGIIVGRTEQLLTRFSEDERARRSVKSVLEQAERIEKVIRGFLGLARGGVPSLRRASPWDVVTGATSLVEHRYAKSGVSLTIDAVHDLPFISCDLGLMEHALVNLLLNSCDACKGGGEVKVTIGSDEAGVAFTVEDDGHGITDADAARATEPFFTTKPVGTGTGLGLAIANEIVKSHRGSLSIGPRAPRGTRARLLLPHRGDDGKR